MPSSALQRSSRNSIANLALLPSPSVTPPASLIVSAAAFMAASLLMPKTRTTPDLAPKPVILTVRSCAEAGAEKASASVPSAANAAMRISMMSSHGRQRFPSTRPGSLRPGPVPSMKLNTFRPPEYHRGKMSGRIGHGQAQQAGRTKRACEPAKSRRKPVGEAGRAEAARAATKRPAAPSARGDLFAGLKPNAANFAPLTPISFLPRTAAIHPDRVAVVHGDAAPHLRRVAGAGAAARLGAGAARRASGRHGVGDAAERAGDARGAFRRADARRGAQHHQHAARCRNRRLHPGARRGEGADHRPRIRRAGRPGARAHEEAAAGDRRRRPALHRPGRAARQDRVRGFHRDGRSGVRRPAA